MDLSKIDPNLIAGIVTLLGTLATYALGRARGTKQRDLTELVDEAVTAEVVDALEDGETSATIERRLTTAVMALGGKLGVKLPPATVNVAVQWGVMKFRQEMKQREANQLAAQELPENREALIAQARRIADKLAALSPAGAIDTITPAKEAGVELEGIRADGTYGPMP
jgi:hypothetical protein